MEQCIFCQSVFEKADSNSSKPTSLCSVECEKGFNEHQKAITCTMWCRTCRKSYEIKDRYLIDFCILKECKECSSDGEFHFKEEYI